MLELTGFLGLTRISFFLLTQIPQIPLYCFVGGKSHRCFCVWAGSHGSHFLGSHGSHRSHSIAVWVGNLTDASVGGWLVRIPLCFWAHTDLTDPTVLLCGWEISQMALWVWAPGGCTGLALTDLSFGPFGQIRPIGQIGRIGHF